jgi:hypothetical protein
LPLPAIPFGDTFLANCTYQDSSGQAVSLTAAGLTVSAKIVAPDGINSFPVTVATSDQDASPGQFTITSETSTWATTTNPPQDGLSPDWILLATYGIPAPIAPFPFDSDCRGNSNPPTIGAWQLRISYKGAQGTFSADPILFRLI